MFQRFRPQLEQALIAFFVALIISGCASKPVHQADLPQSTKQNSSALELELVASPKAVGHRNFTQAKKVLPNVFDGMQEEFYCGCQYSGNEIDWSSCDYQPRKNTERGRRLEWEHVVPAWVIGHQRQCWQNGGRKNCTATDLQFQMAEGDLNNLETSIGEINGDRSNYAYSAWAKDPAPMYGQCKPIVDFKLKKAQPREEVRGRAARITLYMTAQYQLQLSQQDRQLMCAWAKSYPADAWEIERDWRIVSIQGRGNRLVSEPEQVTQYCQP